MYCWFIFIITYINFITYCVSNVFLIFLLNLKLPEIDGNNPYDDKPQKPEDDNPYWNILKKSSFWNVDQASCSEYREPSCKRCIQTFFDDTRLGNFPYFHSNGVWTSHCSFYILTMYSVFQIGNCLNSLAPESFRKFWVIHQGSSFLQQIPICSSGHSIQRGRIRWCWIYQNSSFTTATYSKNVFFITPNFAHFRILSRLRSVLYHITLVSH